LACGPPTGFLALLLGTYVLD
jgi:hypothetical protein